MTSLDFRLKKNKEKKKNVLEEIKPNDLMSKKHKKVCRALNWFEHFLIFVSAVSSFSVSVSALLQ